jgi:hypothetical protein
MSRTILTLAKAVALVALLACPAFAEFSVPINSTAGVYDQPSSVSSGSRVHVAFIGPGATDNVFSLYYARIDGAADFTSSQLSRATAGFVLTPSFAIVGGSPGDNAYTDVRHPKIGLLGSDRIVILFQARTPSSPDDYRLFIAQFRIVNEAVTSVTVREAQGLPDGDIEDVTFGTVSSDNSARAAFAQRAAGSTGLYDVWYARISLDNGYAVQPPLLLSDNVFVNSKGSKPLPNLKIDGANRSHVAWSAGNGPFASIYYAMVKEFADQSRNNADNAAIAATGVIGGTRLWTHPQLLLAPNTNSTVYIVAADESVAGKPGPLVWVNLNPDAAPQDNGSVMLGTNNSFLITPPGIANPASPEYDLYRPEAHIDLGGRIHFTSYGNSVAPVLYTAVKLQNSFPYFVTMSEKTQVGYGNNAASYALDNDYSKAAFSFIGGKTIIFWSGTDNTNTANRQLMVTGLPAINEYINFNEKGCSTLPGGSRTTPWADILCLGLPLLVLRLRNLRGRGRVGG